MFLTIGEMKRGPPLRVEQDYIDNGHLNGQGTVMGNA